MCAAGSKLGLTVSFSCLSQTNVTYVYKPYMVSKHYVLIIKFTLIFTLNLHTNILLHIITRDTLTKPLMIQKEPMGSLPEYQNRI